MVQIASQNYARTYVFSICSFTFFMRVLLLAVVIVVPFFAIYQTGNFYQGSHMNIQKLNNVNLKPTYEYFVSLKTSTQSYQFTNLFVNPSYQSINIKFLDQTLNSLKVTVQYPKIIAEKVQAIDIFVLFQYTKGGATNLGMLKASAEGYNLAEVIFTGFLQFMQGTGSTPILSTSDILRTNQFDFQQTYQDFYKSSSYLSYKHNSFPLDLPTDIFRATMMINYPNIMVEQTTPSILGQLIWSFIQYCPIFLVLYWIADVLLLFMLREGILKRTIKHDKEYLSIVRSQQDKLDMNVKRIII